MAIPPAVSAGAFLWRAFVVYSRIGAINNVLNVNEGESAKGTDGDKTQDGDVKNPRKPSAGTKERSLTNKRQMRTENFVVSIVVSI